MIINIITAITGYIGVDIANNNEFIINNVTRLQNSNMPTKKQYQDMIEKQAKKDQKAKSMPTYEDTYNSSLIIFTLVFILISIQINIPDSVTTLGDLVFANNISVTSLTIGQNVTIISKFAFRRKTSNI